MDTTTTLPSTWQEALEKHPISGVRAFEKQLRASTLRDGEKLRALVGRNYRDLLATAEQIVELNNQNREAEVSISGLSQACKPPTTHHEQSSPSPRASTAGQLLFLNQLIRCTSSATQDRSVTLASKTLVISRLLLKHLEESNVPAKTLHWLQSRWRLLRQQLLQCIDGLLTRPLTSLAALTQAIGAYCLTTSSSASDAVKHFQSLRAHRLGQHVPGATEQNARLKQLRQKCHYLISSVTATKALCGRGVTEFLQDLQKQALLQDAELAQVETLQLDVSSALLPADVVRFMPYFRRVTPSASDVRSSIQVWVSDMIKHIARDIEDTLANANLIGVLRARKQIFSILLPACFTLFLHEGGLGLIRQTFSQKVLQLVMQLAQEVQETSSALRHTQDDSFSESLWTSDLVRKVNARMGSNDLRTIRNLHLGANSGLQALFKLLQKWLRRIQLTREELQNLSKMRWQDKMEEYDDEDEEIAKDIVSGLARDDPDSFLKTLDSASLDSATSLTTAVGALSSEAAEKAFNAAKSTMTNDLAALLRVVRETRDVFESLFPNENFLVLAESSAKLEEALGQQTALEVFTAMESNEPSSASTFVAQDLPSPVAVSVLQQLCISMTKTGGLDLWTSTAARKLRSRVLERVMDAEKKGYYIHSDFDEHYLQLALGGGVNEHSPPESQARKAAMYWNRTRTLFGVLNA